MASCYVSTLISPLQLFAFEACADLDVHQATNTCHTFSDKACLNLFAVICLNLPESVYVCLELMS